jgi:hypothetical protein
MELLSRNERLTSRSGSKFSSANQETSFLSRICALVPLGSTRRSPSLRAAPADSAHPLSSFPARQEKPVGEQPFVATSHARMTLAVYRSRAPMSTRLRVSSAARHRSRMEPVVSGAVHPDIAVSSKPAGCTAFNNNLARGKSEKKDQKIYNPSSQPVQNTTTLDNKTISNGAPSKRALGTSQRNRWRR